MRRNRGFTLIEVLIVVVIIAVLAALILPRMTAAGKRADAAEAMQMIGVMKRAVDQYLALNPMDDNNNSLRLAVGMPADFGAADEGTEADWARLGLKPPVSSKWAYIIELQYIGGMGGLHGYFMAISKTKLSGGGYPLAQAYLDGSWSCVAMTNLYDRNNKQIGCTF